uniref:Uncharacterized protein n=1 Tax=Ascaris lumbricoides TaxID=6252 RepID=A0A0M3HY93_ASCLU
MEELHEPIAKSITVTASRSVRSKRPARRTPTGTKGINESLEEHTQKSDLKVPKAEVANANQDAAVGSMLMTTAKNNALKLSEDKTAAAVPPEPPESEDCQRAMLMHWFGAPPCSATPKAKRKGEACPHDDDTQRSHIAFSNRKQEKKTRTSIVNQDSKFESLLRVTKYNHMMCICGLNMPIFGFEVEPLAVSEGAKDIYPPPSRAESIHNIRRQNLASLDGEK